MSQSGPSSLMKLFSKTQDKVEEEILSMVEEGYEQGVIEDNEVEMISNIFEFGDKDAKDIMTGRKRIVGIEKLTTVADALPFTLENNFSRYPVYEEDIDNIVGVIHIKDLFSAYLKNPDVSISEVMDEPTFIHPTYNISKLLEKMQKEKIHMSIVVDEYGQTEGLVAMEDIIEEIVGNIFDEHDESVEEIKRLLNGTYMVYGSATLNDLSDVLDIEFPDEDFETLNGFILYKLGRLPMENEEIEVIYEGYKFTPTKICDNIITLVKIEEIKTDD